MQRRQERAPIRQGEMPEIMDSEYRMQTGSEIRIEPGYAAPVAWRERDAFRRRQERGQEPEPEASQATLPAAPGPDVSGVSSEDRMTIGAAVRIAPGYAAPTSWTHRDAFRRRQERGQQQ